MAKGTDREELVVSSNIQPGLKREFAFALKSQADYVSSNGRTRTRKSENAAWYDEVKEHNKRFKSSVLENVKSSPHNSSVRGELVSDGSAENDKARNVRRDDVDIVHSATQEEPNSDVVGFISDDELKGILVESSLIENMTENVELAVLKDQSETFIVDKRTMDDSMKRVICDEGSELLVRFDGPPCEVVAYENLVEVKADPVDMNFDVAPQGDGTGKLEIKISKRVELKRIPKMVKELLGTGLLEGLAVKYQRGAKTRGSPGDGLKGIISGTGILCSCEDCAGTEVVSPNVFELHAGSGNKRPPDYIYLENGKNLRDVLNACKAASLESLEASILNVIGGLSADKHVLCQSCKCSIAESNGTIMSLCRLCLIKKESQPNFATTLNMRKHQCSPTSTLDMKECQPSSVLMSDMEDSQPSPPPVLDINHRSQKTPLSKPLSSGIACSSQQSKTRGKITRKSQKTPHLKPSDSGVACSSQRSKSQGKITRKDLRLHKLVFRNDILPDGTELAYYVNSQKCLEGYKRGSRIFCFCCQSEVSPSQFEAHAGYASHRKPYTNIFTSNGVSLHELAVKLSNMRRLSEEESDDLCSICANGGDLLCCGNCPRAFHTDCVSLPSVPAGTWYCKYCESMFHREKFVEFSANAIAAGRIVGMDPLEEIKKRCIRIFGCLEPDEDACALCRGHDFVPSGFGPQTVIYCDQCEKQFHVACLKEHKMDDLKELPTGNWFCCEDCSRIHSALQEVVVGGYKGLPESLLSIVKTKVEKKGFECGADLDIRWTLLSGRMTSGGGGETNVLSKAVAIFHDQFDPVVDPNSGVADLIPHIVFGRKVGDQDFGGTYCAVLRVNSNIVSAGVIRIFGKEVAELPLVATRTDSQGQGYFQVLFSCMESLLISLNVKKLVLPAADEAESLWTKKFGFDQMLKEEVLEYKKYHRLMVFHGTSMLQKSINGS